MTTRFGHDGWHGTLAHEVTFDRITSIARSAASVMVEDYTAEARVVVGFDRRFMADEFARAIAAELAALGIEPWLIPRPVPTPVVSHTIPNVGATGGIVVTAGHLPAMLSGIKLRHSDGGALPRATLDRIEKLIDAQFEPQRVGPTASIAEIDPVEEYLNAISDQVPVNAIQNAGLTIAVDPMWGATGEMLPQLIEGRGSKIVEIRSAHNPAFPGLVAPEPAERNLDRLRRVVSTGSASFGIAISGDGSTLALVDDNGGYVNGETVFSLITHYLLAVERQRGALARSIGCSTVIDRLAETFGVTVHEFNIGFTNFSAAMRDYDLLIAGDEWGGVILADHLLDRDAVLAGMLISSYVVETGQSISELIGELHRVVGTLHSERRQISLTDEQLKRVGERLEQAEWPDQIAARTLVDSYQIDGQRLEFEDGSWILLRIDEYDRSLQLVAEAADSESATNILDAGRRLMLG